MREHSIPLKEPSFWRVCERKRHICRVKQVMEEGKRKKVTVMEGFETKNVDVLSSEDDP